MQETKSTARQRLAERKRILELIYERRMMDNDDGIGAAIEHRILGDELSAIDRPRQNSWVRVNKRLPPIEF